MQILDIYSGNNFNMTDLPMDENLKELYRAIWGGSLKNAKKAIKNHLKRAGRYTFSDDVLMQAIASGHEGIAKLMIKSGADVNSVSPSGYSALMVALEHKMPGLAEYLINKGADTNHMDQSGQTPFHCAIRMGLKNMAHRLAMEIIDPNIKDECNKTPIMYAAYYDAGEIVDTFLKKGADVNACDTMGVSPLMLSINNRIMLVLDHIYRNSLHKYDPSVEWLTTYLPAYDGQDIEMIIKLLDHGAKLHAKENFGNTPLMLAAISGNLAIVNTLVERGAEVDAKDNVGSTALMKAIHKGHFEIAECLLKHGADSNQKKFNGAVSLHYAVQNRDLDSADLLLRHGADPNYMDVEGISPFRCAVLQNWNDGVVRLLKFGVNVNEKDREGWTPSDCAYANRFNEMAEYLKSHGGKAQKKEFDHFEIFLGVEDGSIVNDRAFAYCIKTVDEKERLILALAVGYEKEKGGNPVLRKMIISCAENEIQDLYCGFEDYWFHYAKFVGHQIVEEKRLADKNNEDIFVPRDDKPEGFNIFPDNVYEDDFKRLSHSLFQYVDYNETFHSESSNCGKLVLTEFGKEKLGEVNYYATLYSSIEFANKVVEMSKLYIK